MVSYSTPKAYYERVDVGAPAVAPVRMDVAAFVGIAETGPLHTAVPIGSWRQFVAYFGDVSGAGYLAYVVRAFFENGGRRCWAVRVASPSAATAQTDVLAMGGAPAWRVSAWSAGVWGNDLDLGVQETHRAHTPTVPSASRPEFSSVSSTTGFERGTHVRIIDGSGSTLLRVVSAVDAARQRLYWVNPEPSLRLPYDAPIAGVDLDAPLMVESIEYTLVVRRLGALLGVYERLSLIPEHPRYAPRVFRSFEVDPSRPRTWELSESPAPIVVEELRDALTLASLAPLFPDDGVIPLSRGISGADGLAGLRVEDFIGEPALPFDGDEARRDKTRGLAALDAVTEVAAVAIPDILIQPEQTARRAPLAPCIADPCLPAPPPGPSAPPLPTTGDLPPIFDDTDVYRAQAALVEHCERHADRIALLDPPFSTVKDARLGVAAIRAWRKRFDSKFAALYFPWTLVVDPLREGDRVTRAIPPCGHVAGYFAASDRAVGVHKAPANGTLGWVQDLSTHLDDVAHGVLNDEQIDVLRALPGRGARILGARTLSDDGDFRYVNVRRLLMMIERALALSTRWAVFEPNNPVTRGKLHASITSFLITLWRRGALAGKNPRQAFFVRCDESTTPASARDRGELVVEVGVAPSIPYEFVVVRVGRAENLFELSEVGHVRGRG